MTELDEATHVYTPKPLTVDERLNHLEAQQITMASSYMRSISRADRYAGDSELQLRYCMAEVRSLRTAMWMLTTLNIMLFAILILREFWR